MDYLPGSALFNVVEQHNSLLSRFAQLLGITQIYFRYYSFLFAHAKVIFQSLPVCMKLVAFIFKLNFHSLTWEHLYNSKWFQPSKFNLTINNLNFKLYNHTLSPSLMFLSRIYLLCIIFILCLYKLVLSNVWKWKSSSSCNFLTLLVPASSISKFIYYHKAHRVHAQVLLTVAHFSIH